MDKMSENEKMVWAAAFGARMAPWDRTGPELEWYRAAGRVAANVAMNAVLALRGADANVTPPDLATEWLDQMRDADGRDMTISVLRETVSEAKASELKALRRVVVLEAFFLDHEEALCDGLILSNIGGAGDALTEILRELKTDREAQ